MYGGNRVIRWPWVSLGAAHGRLLWVWRAQLVDWQPERTAVAIDTFVQRFPVRNNKTEFGYMAIRKPLYPILDPCARGSEKDVCRSAMIRDESIDRMNRVVNDLIGLVPGLTVRFGEEW